MAAPVLSLLAYPVQYIADRPRRNLQDAIERQVQSAHNQRHYHRSVGQRNPDCYGHDRAASAARPYGLFSRTIINAERQIPF